jgi:phenylpropionate dioxygenase-like ring-hydroxylating dioxygenase large terminal subunit
MAPRSERMSAGGTQEATMATLADDQTVIQRILDHIDRKTTDLGEASWREPVENYRSPSRLDAELACVLRRHPIPFCPSAALVEKGAYVARDAAHTPILAVRGADGVARAFRNACRHRGTQVATGTGCEKAFVCRYHGWTYGLDGALRHVPHEDGFLGLDKRERGLVPVTCIERSGVVFVAQDPDVDADALLAGLPPLLATDWTVLATTEAEIPANWKIFAESFLEGYHIRSTHSQTFYPVQYDNLNVIERFGRNSRIAYPYRAIEKLRTVPPAERSVDGKLTYVYHLFPNAMIATFPANRFLIVLEPLTVETTRLVTYVLGKPDAGEPRTPRPPDPAEPKTKRGLDLVDAGATEDRGVVLAIQRSLASGANDFFEFGRFESAIGHFHRALDAAIDGTPWREPA